jgi:hypothetical protein
LYGVFFYLFLSLALCVYVAKQKEESRRLTPLAK